MWPSYSLELFLAVPTVEWSACLIGIGVIFGLLIGFWLGTYLTVSKDPENTESLTEDFYTYHPRKPTLTPEQRKARERRDLL
jgi:hypothetical protein